MYLGDTTIMYKQYNLICALYVCMCTLISHKNGKKYFKYKKESETERERESYYKNVCVWAKLTFFIECS